MVTRAGSASALKMVASSLKSRAKPAFRDNTAGSTYFDSTPESANVNARRRRLPHWSRTPLRRARAKHDRSATLENPAVPTLEPLTGSSAHASSAEAARRPGRSVRFGCAERPKPRVVRLHGRLYRQ